MSVVVAALLGLGLGIVTGMPLGVINVAIVDAAALGRRQFAIGIGIGGAIADAIHAALAFLGIGALVTAKPEVVRVLAIAAAALIVGYALFAWRGRRPPTRREAAGTRSILTGLLLTLPNPGALSAWVAVAVALWPGARLAEAIALAVGVGLGSAAWFAFLAHLVGTLPRDHRALRVIPKLALVGFLGIAVVSLVRVL